MEMNHFIRVRIQDSTQIAEARRVGTSLAGQQGFDETDTGKLAIAITEAATNQLKHASGGELLLRAASFMDTPVIEVLALDKGPGIANLQSSMKDGYSTSGTSGTGLGAILRQSSLCDVYTATGRGTAVLMQFWAAPPAQPILQRGTEIGAVAIPIQGENVCGDGWACKQFISTIQLLIVDGLGHGLQASDAGAAAIQLFNKQTDAAPGDILKSLHLGMKATRGAAAAVMEANAETGMIRYAGVGNTAGYITDMQAQRHMVSHNGTLGVQANKIQEFNYNWPADNLLIFTTDGITTQLGLKNYPGLQHRHCTLIAGVLYRDFSRGRDDATVVVIRRRAA